jgi:hypothetical protein
MNILIWCLATPAIFAGTYGMTALLWTAVGIGLPGRRRLFGQSAIRKRLVSVQATPMPHLTRHRIAWMRHDLSAALPQKDRHGIGAHINN